MESLSFCEVIKTVVLFLHRIKQTEREVKEITSNIMLQVAELGFEPCTLRFTISSSHLLLTEKTKTDSNSAV